MMDIVLKALKEGKSDEEAFKLIEKSPLIKIYWMKRGLSGEEPYKYFLYEINKINIKNEYEDVFGDENSNEYKILEKELEEEKNDIYKYNYSKKRHELIIKYLEHGIKLEDAAKLVDIPLNNIQNWINNGEFNLPPYTNFYKDYIKTKNYLEKKNKEEEIQIKNEIISLILKGFSFEYAARIVNDGESENQIINWYNLGKISDDKHVEFYDRCEKAKNSSKSIQIYTIDKLLNTKINIFLKTLELTKDEEHALKEANVDYFDIQHWCKLAKENEEDFNSFLKDYKKIIRCLITKKEKDDFNSIINKRKINSFIDSLEDSPSIKNGLNKARLTTKDFVLWKKYGELDIKPFVEFTNKYETEKEFIIKEKLEIVKKENSEKLFAEGYSVSEVLNKLDLIISEKKEEHYNNYKMEEIKIGEEELEITFKDEEEQTPEKNEEFSLRTANKLINLIKEGYEINKAVQMCNLTFKQKNSWIKKGQQGIDPYEKFYLKYLEAKIENTSNKKEYEELKDNRKIFLEKIKEFDEEKILNSCGLTKNQVESWKEKGEKGISPYNQFYRGYLKIINKKSSDLIKNELSKEQIDLFMECIKKGLNEKKSLKESNITKNQLNFWLEKGKKGISPFDEFVIRYYRSISYAEFNMEEFERTRKKQQIFIEKIIEGESEENALLLSELIKEEVDSWNEKGEEKISPYFEFYDEYKNAKNLIRKIKRNFNTSKKKQKIFLINIENKISFKDACEGSGLDPKEVEEWIIRGSENHEPFNEFYKKYQTARKESTKIKKQNDLKIVSEKWEKDVITVIIEGKTHEDDENLLNLLKTFKDSIKEIKTETKYDSIKIHMELELKEEGFNFIRSLLK